MLPDRFRKTGLHLIIAAATVVGPRATAVAPEQRTVPTDLLLVDNAPGLRASLRLPL